MSDIPEQSQLRVVMQIDRLLNECPFGIAYGKLVTPRNVPETDLVAWVSRLYDLRESLRKIIHSKIVGDV